MAGMPGINLKLVTKEQPYVYVHKNKLTQTNQHELILKTFTNEELRVGQDTTISQDNNEDLYYCPKPGKGIQL